MKRNNSMTNFLMFFVCLVFGAGQLFAAWDGSSVTKPEQEGKYFIIDTEAKLAWYASHFSEGNAKLTADLDMGGKLWTPIAAGTGDVKYGKVFDGNGHVIKNLYISGNELATIEPKNAQNLGFIGTLGGGTVKNLILENVNIHATTNAGDILSGKDQQISVGAFVGWMADNSASAVENSIASGTIKTTGNGQGVGGIVGNAKSGSIVNCLSLVEIQTSGNNADIGGIIGIVKVEVSVKSSVYAGPGLRNTGAEGSVGGIAGNVISGALTAENDFFEGDGYNGIGRFCETCSVVNTTKNVDLSNTEKVVCSLNGQNEDESCIKEPWSVGETSLSLNGYGPDGYKIVFDANGGVFADGSGAKDKFLHAGMAIVANEVDKPSRDDYAFAGWSFDRDGKPVKNLGLVSKTDTVFAVWEHVYTISFDVAPGYFPSGDNEQVKTIQVAKGETITVEGLGGLPTSYCGKKNSNNKCVEKYYFTGWALESGADENDSVSLSSVKPVDGLMLYAVWTEQVTYTVTYNANHHGRTSVDFVHVDAGESVTQPVDPIADDGYEFVGWFTDEQCEKSFDFTTKIKKSIVLYAKWNLKEYKISYALNGGLEIGDNPETYTVETPTFALNTPVGKKGRVFEGWFYDSEFTKKATQIVQGTVGKLKLYAKWSKQTYKITYLADNNSYGSVSDQYKVYGTAIELESAGHFLRADYVQDGWATSPDGKKVYDFGYSYTKNAELTLYPHWVTAPAVTTTHYGAITVYEYASGRKVAEIDGEYTGSDVIDIPEDLKVDKVELNRVFIKNVTSTIVLPFTINVGKVKGGKFYKFSTVREEKIGCTVMKASSVPKTLYANTPYLVEATDTKIEFEGEVTFNTSTPPAENLTSGLWEFVGVYNYMNFKKHPELGRVYGFAGEERNGVKIGQFVQVAGSATIKPMRAYLVKHQISKIASYRNALKMDENSSYSINTLPSVIDVEITDENDNVLKIGKLNTVTGEVRVDRWFDLKGRKLNAEPKNRGSYYRNGKRVIVK